MKVTGWGRGLGVVALVTASVIPASAASASEPGGPILSDGVAAASGLFITYEDRAFIIPGGTFPPPDIAMPFAAGGIDLSDTATAVGALGYSPYVELFGAINSVSPPGAPPFPAEAIGTRSRASVAGQPPKEQDASMTPGQDALAVGTARASLGEGPVAEAVGRGFQLAPADGLTVAEAATQMRVSKASGVTVTEAVTRLGDININDLVRIESITLTATSSADGRDGLADTTVTVQGVRVGGVAVRITESGLEVADQAVPMGTAPLNQQLAQAGIEFVAPGMQTTEPGGQRSLAEASGPELQLKSPNGEHLSVFLGRAVAVATAQLLPPPPFIPDGPGTDLGATTATTGATTAAAHPAEAAAAPVAGVLTAVESTLVPAAISGNAVEHRPVILAAEDRVALSGPPARRLRVLYVGLIAALVMLGVAGFAAKAALDRVREP